MSLAIAYGMKKRSKKMAEGGEAKQKSVKEAMEGEIHGSPESNLGGKGYMRNSRKSEMSIRKQNPDLYKADGGFIDEEKSSGYEDHKGNDVKSDSMAMTEDDRSLNQHGENEEGPQGMHMCSGGSCGHPSHGMAEGGFIGSHQTEDHEDDMVGRIMKKRQQMYSEGGKVANQDKEITGDMPNEFDDLHLRDDLESSYTGSNSGDELGNDQEDEDRNDIVSRIMRSRAKKDRNPRPA
jgi:hypothetical protein